MAAEHANDGASSRATSPLPRLPHSSDSALGNYAISYATRANGLTITPRSLLITADAQARVYGDANPALTYTTGGAGGAPGLVNGDTLSGVLATGADVRSNVGDYAITQGSLAASVNYQVTYTGATLTVTQRPLTVTADNQSRLPGEANPVLTFVVSGLGLVNGDLLSGMLATAATPASAPGAYTILQGSLVATPNYQVRYVPGTLLVGGSPAIPLAYRAGTQQRDTFSAVTIPAAGDAGLTVDTNASNTVIELRGTNPPTAICPKEKPCRRSN